MKIISGTITSIVDSQTVIVQTERKFKHPLYGKLIKKNKKFHVHVPAKTKLTVGDQVEMQETRPISKNKKFVLVTNQKSSQKK